MNDAYPIGPHPRRFNRLSAFFIVLVGLCLAGWAYDVYEDRSHSLVLTEAVRFYSSYDDPARLELGWITAANTVEVRRIRFTRAAYPHKNHRAILVRLKDGREGWILAESGFELKKGQ